MRYKIAIKCCICKKKCFPKIIKYKNNYCCSTICLKKISTISKTDFKKMSVKINNIEM